MFLKDTKFIGYLVYAQYALCGFGLLLLPQVRTSPVLFSTLVVTNVLLLAGVALYFWRGLDKECVFEIDIRAPHVIQSMVQFAVVFYLCMSYMGAVNHFPLILIQICFANQFHFLLSVFKNKFWSIGFSNYPIVFSINFFLWFKPEYFWAQILLVAAGVLSKSYLVRPNGKHIFNPSGIAMAAAAYLLIAFRAHCMVDFDHLITYQASGDGFFLFVFLAGLFCHYVGRVSYISMGAVAGFVIVDLLCLRFTGMPSIHRVIPHSLFLGLTLLVTDPVTSPKTPLGQVCFGACYALSAILADGLLSLFSQPVYTNKVLFLPLLNYWAARFDKIELPLIHRWLRSPVLFTRWAPVVSYILVFTLCYSHMVYRPPAPAFFLDGMRAIGKSYGLPSRWSPFVQAY